MSGILGKRLAPALLVGALALAGCGPVKDVEKARGAMTAEELSILDGKLVRITRAMTPPDVEGVLGSPPDSSRGGGMCWQFPSAPGATACVQITDGKASEVLFERGSEFSVRFPPK